ncbi:MAG: nucleotidyl transferase AbiEii/AbiGii toxin family protein [Planctomycetes bacterium]|nr:nucleotidyl transferase AbiEii/AbiGii toxin family protein [Planctomycetota bacterium]
MDRIAQAASAERAELFRSSAAALHPDRSPAIIEKDFWVCWTLHRIYAVLKFQPELIFKGGTSLSKAYNAIERFSEDVDLCLSRRHLGFTDSRDPEEEGISKKESRRRIEALTEACQAAIRDRLLPDLRTDFTSALGTGGWSVELDAIDPQTIIFTYPRSEPGSRLPAAIRPAIRLEMGARSDDWPAEDREIRSYAAEAFPVAFEVVDSCRVHVLDARRTFWEKATLLHAESHRPAGSTGADRLSRHYYDVYQLSRQDIGRQALDRIDLLERVVAHKQLFFSSAWSHFETAMPGSLHLVPPAGRMSALEGDYTRMREMIFGAAPPWDEIIQGLRELEERINGK